MRIDVDEAREYFAHPTQQKAGGITPEELPEEPFQYWANGGVCGCFHPDHWPGVWMAHYGVKPEAWGDTVYPARRILRAFWAAERPELILGWTDSRNRAALSFARRIGFRKIGEMTLSDSVVVMQEWAGWE